MSVCGRCGNTNKICTCFTTSFCPGVNVDLPGAAGNYISTPDSDADFFVDLPGTSGNYISTPDSPAVSVTGDIDIRARVALDDLTSGSDQALVGKYNTPGDVSYAFDVRNATGTLRYFWSVDGAIVIQKDSTVALTAVASDGAAILVRVTHDVDNGAAGNDVKFYTSTDGVVWAQLGTTITTAGITSIFDGAALLTSGALQNAGTSTLMTGHVYSAEVRNGIDGPVVARFDAEDAVGPLEGTQTPGTVTSSATGEVWTLNGAGWVWGQDALVTGDIDLRARLSVADWVVIPDAFGAIIAQWEFPDVDNSYLFHFTNSGRLQLFWSEDGSTTKSALAVTPHGFTPGSTHHVGVTLDINDGAGSWVANFYTFDGIEAPVDIADWTLLGTSTQPGATSIHNSDIDVTVGAYDDVSGVFNGNIYYAEIRNGINGPVVARFAAEDAVPTPTSGSRTPSTVTSSSTAETWAINGELWFWEQDSESGCVEVSGNGSPANPFQFHSTAFPTPRPQGYIRRTTIVSFPLTPVVVEFDLDSGGIEGGMTDLSTHPTRLTAPVDGVYLVGGCATTNETGTATSAVLDFYISVNGVNTIAASPIHHRGVQPAPFNIVLGGMGLIQMSAGDYIEMNLDSDAASAVTIAGFNLQDSDGFFTTVNSQITMWANWIGDF